MSLKQDSQNIPLSSNLRSIAIISADTFRNSLFSNDITKSTQPLEIESVNAIDISSLFLDIPTQDSVYVINYKENAGFSLVASNEFVSDVLVSTESGTIDCNKLFSNNAQYDFEGEEIMYRYVESLLYNYEEDKANRHSEEISTRLNPGESYDVWYTDSNVYPIVHYKWGQSYPFNMCMPDTPDTLSSHDPTTWYRGKYCAGCTIIAAMQMVAATSHPSSVTLNSYVYNMSQFGGVSMYYNYDDFMPNHYDTNVGAQLKIATQKLAYLIRWFADSINASYYPDGSTGASISNAMSFLSTLDYNRYSNWSTVDCPNGIVGYEPSLYSLLDLGKPVIIGGDRLETRGETVGHTWLIDGYINQHITRPNNIVYRRHLVHFNWGWRGQYDGYFFSTNVSSRQEQDLIYDTNPESVSNVTRNYSIDTKYYPY